MRHVDEQRRKLPSPPCVAADCERAERVPMIALTARDEMPSLRLPDLDKILACEFECRLDRFRTSGDEIHMRHAGGSVGNQLVGKRFGDGRRKEAGVGVRNAIDLLVHGAHNIRMPVAQAGHSGSAGGVDELASCSIDDVDPVPSDRKGRRGGKLAMQDMRHAPNVTHHGSENQAPTAWPAGMAQCRRLGAQRVTMETHLTDITRVIQLAIAPVFLLTAIGTLITALNNRLGRIVDRRRVVHERLLAKSQPETTEEDREMRQEWRVLSRRIRLIYFAMLSAGLGALLVCLVVAGAFIGALIATDLSRAVAVLFVMAMFAVIATLGMFLREVFLAVSGGTHRIP